MNPNLSEQLLQAVAGVVVIIITGYLIPWLKAEIEKRKLDFIYDWIGKAVYAAEKIAEKEEIDKYEYVCNFIMNKFNLSEAEAKILIESAVKILNMEDVWGEVIFPELWDPHSGNTTKIQEYQSLTENKVGYTIFDLSLTPVSSVFIVGKKK